MIPIQNLLGVVKDIITEFSFKSPEMKKEITNHFKDFEFYENINIFRLNDTMNLITIFHDKFIYNNGKNNEEDDLCHSEIIIKLFLNGLFCEDDIIESCVECPWGMKHGICYKKGSWSNKLFSILQIKEIMKRLKKC